MTQFTIDSRDIYEQANIKTKHADWIHKFIKRLDLQLGVDYVQSRDGKKKVYKLTEDIYKKMERNPATIKAKDLFCTKTAPEGFIDIDGVKYMTSLQLASVAEKPHYDVLKDIRREIEGINNLLEKTGKIPATTEDALRLTLNGIRSYVHTGDNGRKTPSYLLDYRAAMVLGARYSTDIRAQLVDIYIKYMEALEADRKYLYEGKKDLTVRHVYVILDDSDGSNKIGVAVDPEKRLRTLQTANKHKLYLMYTTPASDAFFNIEAKAHVKFAEYRLEGEWFDSRLSTDAIITWIRELGEQQ